MENKSDQYISIFRSSQICLSFELFEIGPNITPFTLCSPGIGGISILSSQGIYSSMWIGTLTRQDEEEDKPSEVMCLYIYKL